MKVLLEAGAEPNGADDDGETPLHGGRQGEGHGILEKMEPGRRYFFGHRVP